ncbi:VWA domain-containing protein [Alphaproteobacteria bacterium]|nr:VWA domain-containing protein [Alphaproteobacteria bacterium]
MFLIFFLKLKDARIPVSLNEFLTFIQALSLNFIQYDMNKFYYLARASLVKDERLIDRFDLVFSQYFKGIESIELDDILKSVDVPKEWLQKLLDKNFSKEEMDEIKTLGGFDKLIETLKQRLQEQEKRHQGGSKWIGTAGKSPFGAYGYNPEGIRIGQHARGQGKAVKVWDKRNFRDFDDNRELDTRGLQVALKRLRQWARTGADEELDIDKTIEQTAKNGYLDIKTRNERENTIKIILFLDVGGSMDDYINKVENLFSAAKNVFKNLNFFYFHNCLYEGVWKDNSRKWKEQFSTLEIFRTYGKEYKCIFVGDASMSPYEILIPGGANEHFNQESGQAWLERAITQWPSNLWINPILEEHWNFSQSTNIIKDIFSNRMVPLSLKGIDEGTRLLSKK